MIERDAIVQVIDPISSLYSRIGVVIVIDPHNLLCAIDLDCHYWSKERSMESQALYRLKFSQVKVVGKYERGL